VSENPTDPTVPSAAAITPTPPPKPPAGGIFGTGADGTETVTYGFFLVLVGLVVLVVCFIASLIAFNTAADVGTAMGAITGTVGALVGAFFGIQLGSGGRATAEAKKDDEANKAQALAAVGNPLVTARVLGLSDEVVQALQARRTT
jgi:hypothetical protein